MLTTLLKYFKLLITYPAPSNLNYNYNFGVYVLVTFSIIGIFYKVYFESSLFIIDATNNSIYDEFDLIQSLVIEDSFTYYSVNESFSYPFPFSILFTGLLLLFCLYIVMTNLVTVTSVMERLTKVTILLFVAPIIVLSFLSMYMPLLILYFIIFFSLISLLFSYQNYFELYFTSTKVTIYYILKVLDSLNIISFCVHIYRFVFIGSMNKFRLIVLITNGFCFSYALCTRYYFYNTIIKHITFDYNLLLFIYLTFFIGLMALYFRFIVSFSITLINTCKLYPDIALKSILLTVEPDICTGSTTDTTVRPRFFSFDKHTHNHHYPPGIKVPFWRSSIFFISVGTLAIGSFTAYYTYQQAIFAEQQAIQTERQNDLEEVSQNLMTQEQYKNKWYPVEPEKPLTPIQKHFPEIPSNAKK